MPPRRRRGGRGGGLSGRGRGDRGGGLSGRGDGGHRGRGRGGMGRGGDFTGSGVMSMKTIVLVLVEGLPLPAAIVLHTTAPQQLHQASETTPETLLAPPAPSTLKTVAHPFIIWNTATVEMNPP